jgi:polysaccharide pyruvyl transferase WcaK-like protein
MMKSTLFLPRLSAQRVFAKPRARERAGMRRVGLFGYFGIGNFGNDGSLEAMLSCVRKERPAADILCICGVPAEVEPKFGIRSVTITWRPASRFLRRLDRLLLYIPGELVSLFNAVRHLSRLDALIIPGTGILDDFGTGPRGMPYWLFRWCLLARLFGTKVIFVSIGAGPIHHPLSRWLMRTAVAMAHYRSYRDEISKEFMSTIGFDAVRDSVYPDIAFALPEPVPLRQPSAEGEPITVGVGIMSYNGWRGDKARDEAVYEAYVRKILSFIGWLLAEGYRVRVLMGDSSDQSTVERLSRTIHSDHPGPGKPALVAEPAHSLHDVMAQIADTDIVVATRYHNVVCALKLGRPTLSIGYADKNDVLLAAMGLGDFCQHIDQLDLDLLIHQFRKLTEGRKNYERKIAEANAIFTNRLLHQQALLLGRYI